MCTTSISHDVTSKADATIGVHYPAAQIYCDNAMIDSRTVCNNDASGARPDLTSEQCMRLWIDLMETTDQLLRSGLKATLAEGEDFDQRYRQWHEEKAREHDKMIETMARRLQIAEDRNAS